MFTLAYQPTGPARTAPAAGDMLTIKGRNVHYHRRRRGEDALVLLHGCGSLGEETLAAFSDCEGYDIYALDRPGYGFSDPITSPCPRGQARWLADFLSAAGLCDVTLVAHSLASGPALALAVERPELLRRVILISPFCKPTFDASMPLLRLATTPILGAPVRQYLVPAIADTIGPRKMAEMLAPQRPPAYLGGFPYRHASNPIALQTMAAEMRASGPGLEAIGPQLRSIRVPVKVFHGSLDRVAEPDKHIGWLKQMMPRVSVELMEGIGHAPHHSGSDRIKRALADGLKAMRKRIRRKVQERRRRAAQKGLLAQRRAPPALPDRRLS